MTRERAPGISGVDGRTGWSLAPLRRLPVADRWLLAEAALALLAVRLALACWPVARAHTVLDRAWRLLGSGPRATPRAPERIAWAVAAVAGRFTRDACLLQAVATRLLLERRGQGAQIEIGFRREDGRLAGHAWVEVDGHALVGSVPERPVAPGAACERSSTCEHSWG